MSNVKVRIKSKYQLCIISDRTGDIRPPREGKQWNEFLEVETNTMDYNEARWRMEKAADILATGVVSTTGTYYGDVIGGEWTP